MSFQLLDNTEHGLTLLCVDFLNYWRASAMSLPFLPLDLDLCWNIISLQQVISINSVTVPQFIPLATRPRRSARAAMYTADPDQAFRNTPQRSPCKGFCRGKKGCPWLGGVQAETAQTKRGYWCLQWRADDEYEITLKIRTFLLNI